MDDLALFVWEFTSRRDFAGMYLLLVAASAAWFGLRSLLTEEARTFGLFSPAVIGGKAARVGTVWLGFAGIPLAGGLALLAAG